MLSLTLVLLLGLLGVSVMSSAIQQERMARNLLISVQTYEQAHQALQFAEAKVGERMLPSCEFCLPPPEAANVTRPGVYTGPGDSSGLNWQAGEGGFYLIQSLGESTVARHVPPGLNVNLYRVTAIRRQGIARSVLESVIARPVDAGEGQSRRILWRQIY